MAGSSSALGALVRHVASRRLRKWERRLGASPLRTHLATLGPASRRLDEVGERPSRPRRGPEPDAGEPLVPRHVAAGGHHAVLLTADPDELRASGLSGHPAAVGVSWPQVASRAHPGGETWCRTHVNDPDVRRWRLRRLPAVVLFAAPGLDDEAASEVRRRCAICAAEGGS